MNVPSFHHVIDTTLHTVSLLANIFSFYIIENNCKWNLQPYKRVFQLTCVNDILLSSAALMCQSVILTDDGIVVLFSNGFFWSTPPSVQFLLQVAFIGLTETNMCFLSVPFIYRYVNVCRGSTSSRRLLRICLIPALLSTACFITAYNMLRCGGDFQQNALRIANSTGWTYRNVDRFRDRLFGAGMTEARLQIHLVVVTLSLTYTYGIVIWTELQVFKKLRELGPSLHPVTRKMHSDVHKALVALAVGPFFSPMLPTLYFVFVLLFHLDFGTLSAFVTILASTITLINPITTCYFVRPFRRAVANHLCFDDKPESSDMSYVSSTI